MKNIVLAKYFFPAVAAVVFLAGGCGEKIDLIGKPAPEFSIKAFDNTEWDNKKIAGKPYILYFFASW